MKKLVATFEGDIPLECGLTLTDVKISYKTWGKLNREKNNVIMLCHHLTANHIVADVPSCGIEGWWRDIVGPDKIVDTNKFFIICSNVLGSCHGSTGPTSINPKTGKTYRMDFPAITIRDMVFLQKKLLEEVLEINKVIAVMGPSLGGMQAIEWAMMYPECVQKIISVGAPVIQTPWGIAWNEIARLAIFNDPCWENGIYDQQPQKGLSLSRLPFVLSCGNRERCNQKKKLVDFIPKQIINNYFPAQLYLKKHGDNFNHDANSILFLINAVNTHDISRGRENFLEIIDRSPVEFNFIGVENDLIYSPSDLRGGLDNMNKVQYFEIHSDFGHNAVILDQEKISKIIEKVLR